MSSCNDIPISFIPLQSSIPKRLIPPTPLTISRALCLRLFPNIVEIGNGDVRAEIALAVDQFVTINAYAAISQIRCARYFASCHRAGYRTKKDILQRHRRHKIKIRLASALQSNSSFICSIHYVIDVQLGDPREKSKEVGRSILSGIPKPYCSI